MARRILIGSANETIIKKLKTFLTENGYEVIGGSTDGYELLRQVHRFYPDLCICEFSLKGMNGHEFAQLLVNERLSPVITLLSASEIHHFSDINNDCFFTYINKPLNRSILLMSIELMIKSSKQIKKLEKDIKHLKKELKVIELINTAKRYLMNEAGLTEEEAHKRIITQSMNEGISKKDVAQMIISIYEDD